MEQKNDKPEQEESPLYEGAFEAADPLTQEEVIAAIRAHRNWVDSPRLRDYLTELWLASGG